MKVYRILRTAKFDALLLIICLIAIYLMVASSSDPLPLSLSKMPIGSAFSQFKTGNEVILNLSGGVIASILTFYLLVRVPYHEKKGRIKRHLLDSYKYYKEQVISMFVGITNGVIDPELVEKLSDPKEFKSYFSSPSAIPGQTRSDYVMNKFEDHHVARLQLESEVLYQELQYAVTAIDITDNELYFFIRRISESLYRSKVWRNDYDGVEDILTFYWQLFTGWNFVSGYSYVDPLEREIRKL